MAAGSSSTGRRAEVLEDPALAALGVEPPARARLARAVAEAGIDPTVVSPVAFEAAR